MKKKITLTIEEEDYNFLKENSINISAYLRALIVQKRVKDTELRINVDEELGILRDRQNVEVSNDSFR